MPTKKRRVGFIPRIEVLNLITKLSFESNLSNSKIISILVEEALSKRGMFNLETGKAFAVKNNNSEHSKNKLSLENVEGEFNNKFKKNFFGDQKLYKKEVSEELLDKEIYAKFLMFLQFEEKMRERKLN
tara:strand:- start:20 stop:406 length:387 start_codon:yes stop_codon:yes gene_type:complete